MHLPEQFASAEAAEQVGFAQKPANSPVAADQRAFYTGGQGFGPTVRPATADHEGAAAVVEVGLPADRPDRAGASSGCTQFQSSSVARRL